MMKEPSVLKLIVAAGLVFLAGTASLIAQTAMQPQGGPMYNPKTEATVSGVVESVELITPPAGRGRRSMGGTHVVVKTDKETLSVHLGPTMYLTEQKLTLVKGDSVEILGSRVTIDTEPVLLARRVKKGQTEWTLRDASGRPVWSGRGRGGR